MTNSTLENNLRLINDNNLLTTFATKVNSQTRFIIDANGYEYWVHGSGDQYTCIVLNMYPNDIHFLTLPEYQGKGYMSYALKELKPLIEMKWGERVKCTVDSPIAERVVQKVGIEFKRNEHYDDVSTNFFKND